MIWMNSYCPPSKNILRLKIQSFKYFLKSVTEVYSEEVGNRLVNREVTGSRYSQCGPWTSRSRMHERRWIGINYSRRLQSAPGGRAPLPELHQTPRPQDTEAPCAGPQANCKRTFQTKRPDQPFPKRQESGNSQNHKWNFYRSQPAPIEICKPHCQLLGFQFKFSVLTLW